MKFICFKLWFKRPIHIGGNQPGFEHTDEFIHSDTLFSALVNVWQMLYPDDMGMFFPQSKNGSLDFPFFRISSAYPFVKDQFYFPKPNWKLGKPQTSFHSPEIAKKIKKLSWIELSIFESWLNGELEGFIPEETYGDGRYWNRGEKTERDQEFYPMRIEDSPRIVKDRTTETTDIFYFSRLFFAEECGLFFLVDFHDESLREKFQASLRLLGDEGIGGDRSVGNGQFEVGETTVEIRTPEDSKYFVSLSLVHPKNGEASKLGDYSSYDLITRRGWIHSERGLPLRRQAVRMFTEGSVFSGFCPEGDIVRVLEKTTAPDLAHDVFRYGKCFCLPFQPMEVDHE
ncbi:type III-A CRISPR-associated RAMP protein Csm4 [candidate division KSB1 bacterium]|nr:type III-A CRISPR-associated RAMP protein Csm4 [candidate division KSB1 bacterium]